jgi:phospholipid N-methyltransferase
MTAHDANGVPPRSRSSRGGQRRLGRFIRQGYEDFERTANFFPSSGFLADAVLESAPIGQATAIVELGPGTGAITQKLLRVMRPDAVLCTIEYSPAMNEELVAHMPDRRLDAVIGDARDAEAIVGARGLVGKVDAVVSSLGLSLLDPKTREEIIDAATGVLAPGGVFIQYVYCHTRAVVYNQHQGWYQFHARRFFEGRFARVSRRFVPLNFPPAWVYTCTRPTR